jgi:hypothetical protein
MKLAVASLVASLSAGCAGVVKPPVVIANPEIRFVVWGNQDPKAFEHDWFLLLGSGSLDRLKEYGVMGATLGPSTVAHPELAAGGAPLSDFWVGSELLSEIPPAPQNVIFVLILPPGVLTDSMVNPKTPSSGYHWWAGTSYAVSIPDERVISHEIYEAATDPADLGYHIGNLEIGDLCEYQYDAFLGIGVQKVWSIAQSKCL